MHDLPRDPQSLQDVARLDALYHVVRENYIKYFRRQLQRKDYREEIFLTGDFPEILQYISDATPTDFEKGFLITINPPDSCEDELHSLLKLISGYKDFLGPYSEWSLEQRSDDPEEPYGYHIHIAMQNFYGKPRSQVLTRSQNALKRQLKNIGYNPQSIDVKEMPFSACTKYVNKKKHCDEQLNLGPQGLIYPPEE